MPVERVRIEHALGHRQRRPALVVHGVDVGALLHQEADDVARAAVDRAVQRRIPIGISRIDVVAQLPRQLDGFERVVIGSGVLADLPDADAGRRHQRRDALLGGGRRVGPEVDQKFHHLGVGHLGRLQERRRPDAVQHVPVAVARLRGLTGVEVGAGRGQGAHEVERVELAERHGERRIAAEVRLVRPDHLVQRRPAVAGRIGIGPQIEQSLREVVLRVVDGQDERAHAVGRQRVVHVGAGADERFEHVDVPLARREQQRREAPFGPGIRIGAGRHQRFDRGHLVLRGRPHQCRLAPPTLYRVHLGAVPQQRLDGFSVAGAGRRHQRSLAFRIRQVRVGPRFEQTGDHRRAAVDRGERERRHAIAVGRVDRGPGVEQQTCDVQAITMGRPVQGRSPIDLRRPDTRSIGQQRPHGRGVARLHGVDQRLARRAGSRDTREQDRRHDGHDAPQGLHHA